MSDWTPTATPGEIARRLASADRVVIVTHAKPDGDAVGSTLALVRALNRVRPGTAVAWYTGSMPLWLSRVARSEEFASLPEPTRDRPSLVLPAGPEPDAVVIADTGSWSQLDALAAWVRARTDRTMVIDHHLQGDPDVASLRLIDTRAAAACQPVAGVVREILPGSLVPSDIGEALYLGLATDTGWFRHSNVTPEVMRLAGDLIAGGVDHAGLYQRVEQQERSARLRLMARALASLELAAGETIALMMLTRDDFREAGAAPGESAGFVEIPLSVASVRASVVLTESSDARHAVMTKVSMRTKEAPDAVDANLACRALGGGGHARAAGARIPAGLTEARRRVLEALS